MNTEENKYDIEISDYNKRQKINSPTKLFYDKNNVSDFSVEAYSQILPPMMKLGRLFRLRKTADEYNKNGILLRQFVGVAMVPLVDSTDKVYDSVKTLFGTGIYKRMMYNFIFPKKIEYKNYLLPGSKKKIIINNLEDYIKSVRKGLPALTQLPSYIIRNFKNTVFDFSKVLEMSLPTRELCSRPALVQKSDELILQNLYRICFGNNPEYAPLFNLYRCSLPPIADNFKSLIIPFKITTTNIRLATQVIDPSFTKIPLLYRRDPDFISAAGMIKFVLGLMQDDLFEGSPLKQELSRKIKEMDHVIFLFHNDTHGFYVDISEFKERNFKFDIIYRYIRSSLKLMIALNSNVLSPLEIDDDTIDHMDDSDAENAEKEINNKIIAGSIFQKDIEQKINDKNDYSGTIKDIDTLLEKSDTLEINTDNLLAKAKARFDNRKDIGHSNISDTANASQTPIAKDPDSISNTLRALSKIDKLSKLADDTTSDDDSESDNENYEDEDDVIEDGSDIDLSESQDDDNAEKHEEESDDGETLDDELKEQNEKIEENNYIEDVQSDKDEEHKKAIVNSIRETIEGKMTEKQKKYLDSIKDKYKSIKFDENETLEDVLKRADAVAIDLRDPNLNIKDKSYNKSVLKDFTKSYVDKTLAKDIVATIKSFSDDNKSNQLIITGFEKKDVSDQFNALERYRFELKDKFGKSHNITFKFPKVDKDGFMYINGNKKLLKKQWVLKPVTKTSPDDVYILSNYNKVHIFRSGKNINKNTVGLIKFLNEIYINQSSYDKIINAVKGDSTRINIEYSTTIEYDEIASSFTSIIINGKDPANNIHYYFNQKEIRNTINELGLDFDKDGTKIPIGIEMIKGKPNLLLIDSVDTSKSVAEDIISKISEKLPSDNLKDLLEKSLKSIKGDSKKMCSKIEIQSKTMPLIILLSGMFGFSEVISKLNLNITFVETSKDFSEFGLNDVSNKNFLKFQNGILYYDPYPLDRSMMLNGLKELKTENLNYEDLDNLNTYIDYTFRAFKSRNLIRGWIAFKDMFLDPKTVECLNALHLPTDLLELFDYANSLLQNNDYSKSSDVTSWRIRDYEMLNTFLYESITENYRIYMQKGKTRHGFSIPEDDVLVKMNKSFVIVNYDTTSPANELKEIGAITYKGPQGINSDRAFTVDKRGNVSNTIGTVAISCPDNGNVGIVKQLTMNPRIVNTLGFVDATTEEESKKLPASSLYSAEESLIPYLNRDSPQRIGFATGQTKHVVPGVHFDIPLVGTGMEQVMPYKVSSTFSSKADQDGKIIKVDDDAKYLIIKYKDGTSERIDYGNKYHKNSDFFLQNNLAINVKEGQNVKSGTILTYNKDFFKVYMNKLMYTQGCIARVAVHDGEVTEEDSSAISWRIANKLATAVIKRKQLVIGLNANVISSVKIGDHVIYGDPLMVYENAENKDDDMALLELLGDTDESVLSKISHHKAEANYTGVIKDIKIYWTVDPNLMSDSAKKFVKQYISKIKKEISEEEAISGKKSNRIHEIEVSKPSGPMKDRINGCVMPKDGGILVEYYIEHTAAKRPGDKVSLNSSLKSVINKVMSKEECAYRINSKSKYNTIDYVTSAIGIMNRMVTSVFHTGFLSKIIFEQGKNIALEYLKDIGEE